MTKTVHMGTISGSRSEGTLLDLDAGLVYTGDVNVGYVEDKLHELTIGLDVNQVAVMISNQHPDKVYHVKCSRIGIDEFCIIADLLPHGSDNFDTLPAYTIPVYGSQINLEIVNNLVVIEKFHRLKEIRKRGEWSPGPKIEVMD